MKTIAQELGIKDFPYEIKDGNGRVIYYEEEDGYWEKMQYDSDGNQIYYENSDSNWVRSEYDSDGIGIYYEDSDGEIIDNRPKEKTDWFTEENVHGTTEQRPPNPLEGYVRRNTTLDGFEVYIDGEWKEWPVPETKQELEGNEIYYENSDGSWVMCEYDSKGNQIYFETSSGYWVKRKYDSEGNRIYTEYSDGEIVDSRPKEIITLNGVKYKRIDE